MCGKFLSSKKVRFLLMGFLVALWWWVEHIRQEDEKRVVVSPMTIPLPDEPPIIPVSGKSQSGIGETNPERSENVLKPSQQIQQDDDLQRIEGIGPKISWVLKQAGINSFGKLGSLEPEQIKSILDQEKFRLARPDTWPEQARLAAAGDWQRLQDLQSKLKGGRRI